MKRFGVLLTSVFLASSIVGCGGGGIPEGSPAGPVKSSQTPEFKDMMNKVGNKMMMKGKGRAKDSSASKKKGS